MKKENVTLDNSINKFIEITKQIIGLKDKIENEINKINKLYEQTNNDLLKFFKKKHEKLIKEENDLRMKLQNEVTKAKEKLEKYLSQSISEIKICEKKYKEIKNLEKEEKNILKDLTYISNINKIIKERKKIFQEPMKTINFYYKEELNNIVYEEYVFNSLYTLQNNENIEYIEYNDIDFNINSDENIFIERKLNDYTEGKYDDEGFFTTPNGSFWDPDGVYFNRDGYDKNGGYYDDNDEYVPGKDWNEKYNCYEDEIIYGDYNEYASDNDYDEEENDYGFMNISIDSILDEEN